MVTIAPDAERVDSTAFYDFLGPQSYDFVTQMCEWKGPQDIAAVLDDVDVRGINTADIGCGSGAVGAFLKSAGAASVAGVDGSVKMLFGAKARGHIDTTHECDVSKQVLPFSDNTFDLCASSGLLPYLSDPSFLISEMVRITKQGSYIGVSFHPSTSDKTECELLPAGSMNGEKWTPQCHTVLPNYHHSTYHISEQFIAAGTHIVRNQNNERGLKRVIDGRWVPLTTILFRKNCSI